MNVGIDSVSFEFVHGAEAMVRCSDPPGMSLLLPIREGLLKDRERLREPFEMGEGHGLSSLQVERRLHLEVRAQRVDPPFKPLDGFFERLLSHAEFAEASASSCDHITVLRTLTVREAFQLVGLTAPDQLLELFLASKLGREFQALFDVHSGSIPNAV